MADEKKLPAGFVRKGGTRFPRLALSAAVEYAVKLSAKTHTGPQPASNIFPGVFNVAENSNQGQIRVSALRQYGLLEGPTAALSATKLAREIATTEGDERKRRLQVACLNPAVFSSLFKTYHGDTVSLAKLKQKAAGEDVHQELLETCVSLFVESATVSGLATVNGDDVEIVSESSVASGAGAPHEIDKGDEAAEDLDIVDAAEPLGPSLAEHLTNTPPAQAPDTTSGLSGAPSLGASVQSVAPAGSARSVVQVNFQLDSSFETEKLAKQLDLLRKYGVI